MKKLVCEMCGGADLVKQDGVFVCQNCGTKYSVEEAKKMMMGGTVSIEGTVSVDGVVKVDASDDLKNLYILARRAKESDNSENACKYYNEIILKDPNSWEANFYLIYYHACNCKKGQIANEAIDVTNCIESTIKLLIEAVGVNDESEAIIRDMIKDLESLSDMMISCAFDISKLEYVGIFIRMQEMLGNCIYQHKGFEKLAIEAWKTAFNTFLVGTYSKNKPCEHLDIFNYNPEKTVKLIYELDPTYEDPFGVAKKLRKNEKFITCPKCGKSFRERESACPECGCTKQEIEQIEEERRIQAEKEAEERRIQAEKEAEEARIRAEQEAAEQAARRKEWWQKNWKKVIFVISILIAVIAVIATFKNISNQKSIALANQYIASGDSCVAIYQFDKAEQFYYSAANSTKDGKTLNIINQKHYDLNDARSAADYEYDQSLKRLRILLAADDYIFNKYSNQELDKMIKIYPNRQETIYYQNLRKQ
jgi:predicted  nucleic acid-binding Zn-ribbon protein